ncbi:hypothetical protein B0H13DRAFT_2532640 [Mycena leptocephala]|nr:hypothetical protein B0H13DRAFT_2532640 [Mycena leptocephala]
MPPLDSADWIFDPQDVPNLVSFFHGQRSRIGQGGNWDKTVLNEAAAHMAGLGPPKAGGPKTTSSCNTKWKQLRKLHDCILQAEQKTYPGASGWTYSDDKGFNVTDDTRDVWNNFSKAHLHFKPFATSGWALFGQMHEILPSRARGQLGFNAASSYGVDQDLILALQSQEDTNEPTQSSENATQSSTDSSQPFSDWSQSNFGDSQAPDPMCI